MDACTPNDPQCNQPKNIDCGAGEQKTDAEVEPGHAYDNDSEQGEVERTLGEGPERDGRKSASHDTDDD